MSETVTIHGKEFELHPDDWVKGLPEGYGMWRSVLMGLGEWGAECCGVYVEELTPERAWDSLQIKLRDFLEMARLEVVGLEKSIKAKL